MIRCPMEECKRPLLAASDVLHILTPEAYDQYTRGQLKVGQSLLKGCQTGIVTDRMLSPYRDRHLLAMWSVSPRAREMHVVLDAAIPLRVERR